MKYTAFQIENFKGIQSCTLNFETRASGKIFTLVGLNESGKTTILESLYMFSYSSPSAPAFDNKTLMLGTWESFIPRDKIGNFSGIISIKAYVSLEEQDKKDLMEHAKSLGIKLNETALPTKITIDSQKVFEESKQVPGTNMWGIQFQQIGRGGKVKKVSPEHWISLVEFLQKKIPQIFYYPTLLFEFPARIYLSDGFGAKNDFYREMLQNVMDAEGGGYNLKRHVFDRLNSDSQYLSEAVFNKSFPHSEKIKIDDVISKLGKAVSKFILTQWNEIFQEERQDKRIGVELDTEHMAGKIVPYLRFAVNDESGKYAVDERSLGFRWFFCFILFTHFYKPPSSSRGAVFLFDEPAANLHPTAQQKLLATFSKIVDKDTILIYTTHSHHMINPNWLEQAFVIRNSAVESNQLLASVSAKTSISALPYRQFIGSAGKGAVSYYQPVLDCIQYSPSQIEFWDDAVLVEGKSDYAVIKYMCDIMLSKKLAIIPCLGANDLGAIIALYLGWGKDFVVLLDGDKAGVEAKARYSATYPGVGQNILLLEDLCGCKKIEDLLENSDKEIILEHFSLTAKLNKKHIMAFFQEILVTKTVMHFSSQFVDRAGEIIDALCLK